MKYLQLPVLLALFVGAAAASQTDPKPIAERVALAWLAEIDAENYAASWRDASALFKQQLSEQQWVDTLTSVRTPLGELVARSLKGAEHTTTLPGAPDGEYVVLVFEAQYENKASAVETVTAMLDDSEWRIAGYYIH